MPVNISAATLPEDNLAALFRHLGQPVRLQILLALHAGEACVCHLEAHLGLRQAAISQHLMVLRDAGLVTASREGRNIYYRISRPDLLDLIVQAARLAGISEQALTGPVPQPLFPCPCPHCNSDKEPSPWREA